LVEVKSDRACPWEETQVNRHEERIVSGRGRRRVRVESSLVGEALEDFVKIFPHKAGFGDDCCPRILGQGLEEGRVEWFVGFHQDVGSGLDEVAEFSAPDADAGEEVDEVAADMALERGAKIFLNVLYNGMD